MDGKVLPKRIFIWKDELADRMAGKTDKVMIGVNQDPVDGLLCYVERGEFEKNIEQVQKECNPINLMHYLDAQSKDGKMCLSNMECAQIEEFWKSGNWDGIIKYIRKYLDL